MEEVFYVGVDVGTASVRAALVSGSGVLRSISMEPISIWEPLTHHYVQSSTDIWDKCCTVVKVRSGRHNKTPHLSLKRPPLHLKKSKLKRPVYRIKCSI